MPKLKISEHSHPFISQNLTQFELDFFSMPTKYPHLRYGQALENVFGLFKIEAFKVDLFYEEDANEARNIAWLLIDGNYEERK